MGDIIDCLNGFHHTSAKSMIVFVLFFYFAGFSILHICLLHNLPYCTHSTDLPAVSQTSTMIDYELHPSFNHPAHCLRAVLSCLCVEASTDRCSIDKPFITSNPGSALPSKHMENLCYQIV